MSEMVERVAKRLHDLHYFGDGGMMEAEELARAAIEAMREPTDAMLELVALELSSTERAATRYKWMAMIDAALDEKPEQP